MNEQQSAEVGIKVIPAAGRIGLSMAPAVTPTGYNGKVYVLTAPHAPR